MSLTFPKIILDLSLVLPSLGMLLFLMSFSQPQMSLQMGTWRGVGK